MMILVESNAVAVAIAHMIWPRMSFIDTVMFW